MKQIIYSKIILSSVVVMLLQGIFNSLHSQTVIVNEAVAKVDPHQVRNGVELVINDGQIG